MKVILGLKFLLATTLILLNLHCSNQPDKSTLSIQFNSKVHSLAENQIQHVFVNVSNGGLGTDNELQVFEWDCELQNCSQISFDTQAGKSRLIQLLVVTENSTFLKKINYGDVTVNLKSGNNTIGINMIEIGNFNAEARVQGKYVPSITHALAGKELTGTLHISIPVGTNKPDMTLMESEIFAGWFSIFVLDNVGFKYRFTGHNKEGAAYSNQPLFNDLHDSLGLKISSPGLQALTNQRAKYSSTLNYFDERDMGVFQERPFSGKITGFFGQNPEGRTLCAKSISPTTAFDGLDGRSQICKTLVGSACTDYFKWSDISVSGSINGSSNTCLGASNLEMEIEFDELGSNDDDFLPFYGPFTKNLTVGHDEIIKLNSSTGELSWILNSGLYLPKGVEVFIRNSSTAFNYDSIRDSDDGIRCEQLPLHEFVSRGTIDYSPGNITLSAAERASTNLKVVLCPKKANGSYFKKAYFFGDQYGSSQPQKLALVKSPQIDGFSGDIHTNICTPFLLQLQDDYGNRVSSQNFVSVNLVSSNANNKFYNSINDCLNTVAEIASVSINNSRVLYFKPMAAPGTTYSIQATDASSTLTASNLFNMYLLAPPTLNHIRLVPDFDRATEFEVATTENCAPFYVAAFSGSGELVPFGGGVSVNLDMAQVAAPGDVSLFSNEISCQNNTGAYTGSTALPNSLNQSFMKVWIRTPASVSTISNILTSCSGAACPAQTIDVVNPHSMDHLQILSDLSLTHSGVTGGCVDLKIGSFDKHKPNSYPALFPSSGSFALSTNLATGGFYSNPSCTAPITSLGVSGSQTTSSVVYYGWPSSTSSGPVDLYFDYSFDSKRVYFKLNLQ